MRIGGKEIGSDLRGRWRILVLDLVPLLEAFHLSGGVDYALFAGEERVTLAADLDLERGLSRPDSEGVATRTSDLSIFIILGMYLLFHVRLNSHSQLDRR